MPLWPFGRKKRRTSTSSQATSGVEREASNEKRRVSDPRRDLASPTQTIAHPPSRRGSRRKRKAASTRDRDSYSVATTTRGKRAEQPVRKTSVQDITALPGMRELESSPHLRPVRPYKPVIPYNLDRGSPARMGVSSPTPDQSTPTRAPRHSQSTRASPPQRRKSDVRRDQALREEEIRAMSAPMQVPKRPAGVNNDLLRRDSKKARRTFSSKQRPDDYRGSNVSLPQSIPSSMSASALSDQRGWQVGGIDVLSPRPTVRLSVPGYYPPVASTGAVSRKGSKKGKLPAIAQETSSKDRRKIADLADELDSSDLRAVLERDARRKEQKAIEQQDRLERKLQRRAEKQRAEEERELRATERLPPTAVHPAFRAQDPKDDMPTGLLTPKSTQGEHVDLAEHDRSPSREGTYLNYPAREDIPQNPFEDPEHESGPFADPLPEPCSPIAERWSPVQTPMEEPVLETARAVRLSQGRLSPPVSPISPFAHPQASGSISELSDLQTQRTSSIPRPLAQEQRRVSESSTRRTGTWASIFRRGPSSSRTSLDYAGKATQSEASFSNVSRESMSRQAIPSHLVQPSSRRSGTPVRTQSKFREDLPDAPMSVPDYMGHSSEQPLTAGMVRPKRSSHHHDLALNGPDNAFVGRTDSPVVLEEEDSELPLSQSLASIDSEGSWISGRPPQRRSTQRLQRDSGASGGSLEKQPINSFTGSFEKLPVPEHEYFQSLTPNSGSRRVSDEPSPLSTGVDPTPVASSDATEVAAEGTPLRHGTAHRRPTVVHNEPRFRSREGLVANYITDAKMSPSRRSSGSESPIEQSTVQNARSVNYGLGHAKSLSAGSVKLLDIPASRLGSKKTSPVSGSPSQTQAEF